MTNELPQSSKFILYTSPNGDIKLDVFIRDETLWLTQKMMAELFDVDVRTVNEHLQSIFKSGELEEDSTVRKIRIVQKEGERNISREVTFYNLDIIIAVDYRVSIGKKTCFLKEL